MSRFRLSSGIRCVPQAMVISLVSTLCISCSQTLADYRIRAERREDMQHLVEAWLMSRDSNFTNPPTIEELTKRLARNGIRLHNPIPKDPSKSCYRVNTNLDQRQFSAQIEEINVRDPETRFVGLIDGSVMMVRIKATPNTNDDKKLP